jgi:hypothetical protein
LMLTQSFWIQLLWNSQCEQEFQHCARCCSSALWIRSCIDSLEIVTARIDLCFAW